MERTRKPLRVKSEKIAERLPDAICGSPTVGFAQISNQVLRDPGLSFKSRGLLCTLLGNHKGQWTSFSKGLEGLGTDGPDSIRTGLKELEAAGYLLRINYVDCKSKQRRGSFWVYTHYRGYFEFEGHLVKLKQMGCEIQGRQKLPEKPYLENPIMDIPNLGNPRQIIPIINKTKNNNNKKDFSDSDWILDLFPQEWKNNKSFQESMKDFIQHRKEKGSKLTKVAASRLAKKLTKYSIQEATQALELSMENGWQGVFPESVSKGSAKKSGNVSIGTMNMKSYEGKDVVYPGGENHIQQGDQE